MEIDTKDLTRFTRRLARAGRYTKANRKKMLGKIGVIVLGVARSYSPMSMSKSQYVRTLKGGKTKRKPTSFTRGSLKNSITSEVFPERVEIGVPINSKAGDYAEKMHDEKGKTWKRLSSGKQPKSTDKYIEKAEKDSRRQYMKAVGDFADDVIGKI